MAINQCDAQVNTILLCLVWTTAANIPHPLIKQYRIYIYIYDIFFNIVQWSIEHFPATCTIDTLCCSKLLTQYEANKPSPLWNPFLQSWNYAALNIQQIKYTNLNPTQCCRSYATQFPVQYIGLQNVYFVYDTSNSRATEQNLSTNN